MATRSKAGAGRPLRPFEARRSLELVPDLAWKLLVVDGNAAEASSSAEPLFADRLGRTSGPPAWIDRQG